MITVKKGHIPFVSSCWCFILP